MTSKSLRQLMVTLHVLTTVGWMTMALAQTALIMHAIGTSDKQTQRAALTMTQFLDEQVLEPAAVATAYTGLMLSALTSWGLFRFRWVAIKFAITVGGLYLGIWWLGHWLDEAVLANENGGIGPIKHSVVWGCALIAAMAFAAWLAVAKPWGQLRTNQRARRQPETHSAVWIAALLVPFVDYALHQQGLLMLATVVAYASYRAWQSRTRPPAPQPAAVPRRSPRTAPHPATAPR